MRREVDAATILRRLLDRHERRAGKRRIIERPTQSFENQADLRALVENLTEAEKAGAVHLVWDRDAPHLIEQVVLVDPVRLYAFTGRTPLDEIIAASISALNGFQADTEFARGLLVDLRQAWVEGGKLMGLGPGDTEKACALVRATDAAFADMEPNIPLRTRSVRLLGDSKALERAMPSLLAYLRHIGVIASDLSADDAMERLGLTKFAQPVLVAGPLLVGDAKIEMIVPHLMDVALAQKFGRPADHTQLATTFPDGSAFFALSEYLKQPGAFWLEQEAIDPRTVQ